MQQVRIEMKRIVRFGLHLFTESIARVVIETKHHSLTDLGDCKIYTVNMQPRLPGKSRINSIGTCPLQPLSSFPDKMTNSRGGGGGGESRRIATYY